MSDNFGLISTERLASLIDSTPTKIQTIRIGPKPLRFNVDEVVAALAHDEEEEVT